VVRCFQDWFRSYGNENREFDTNGSTRARHASVNNLALEEAERKHSLAAGPASGRVFGIE